MSTHQLFNDFLFVFIVLSCYIRWGVSWSCPRRVSFLTVKLALDLFYNIYI